MAPAGVWALLAVQAVVLYAPSTPGPSAPVPHADKLVHAVVFAAPVLWAGLARLGGWLVVALVCALHAPLSEVVQHLALPTRSGDVRDVLADLVGVAVAMSAVAWWLRRPRRRRF